MKRAIVLLPLFILFLSCGNNDLIIQKAKKNCGCIEKLQDGIGTTEFCRSMLMDCEMDPFWQYSNESSYLDKTKQGINNYRIFSKTNSMELVNKSKTKVYKVLVQIDNNGNVNYQEYVIEPTATILLGCDNNFNVEYDRNHQITVNGDCYEALKLSNLSKNKIEYNIHKVELISEY
jgi:hypothetical protein